MNDVFNGRINNKIPDESSNYKAKNTPDASPNKPQGNTIEDLLKLMHQNQEIAEKIFEAAFSFWSHFSDEELFGGKVKNTNPEMQIYAFTSNSLFPLARRSNGAIIKLSSPVLESIEPQSYHKIAAIAGEFFVATMCDAVNEEVQARLPNKAPSVTEAERFSSPQDIDKNNSADFSRG